MANVDLLIFGLGYTGKALAAAAQHGGMRVSIVSRRSDELPPRGVTRVPFSDAEAAIQQATHLVATAAPDDAGDPVLARYAPALMGGPLRWLGYLSTTGVYGDLDGGWAYETTPPAPSSRRAQRRVEAEEAWKDVGSARATDIFRLAGIYGPGRSAIDDVIRGTARRIGKPGHLFGRIHLDDIVGAVLSAIGQEAGPGVRIFNLSDDEPAATADVVAEAARLLGREPPPLIPFSEAEPSMSPMARSFWADNRKVSSVATQHTLARRWLYPTYREGLRAILEQSGNRIS